MSGSEGSGMNILPSPGGLSANSSGAVLKLLYQTWDILESEGYQIVFTEAVDTSFNFVMQQLRTQVFFPTNLILESGEGGRAPPLVSLLPQIKSVVSEILSDDLDNKVAAHHKTLAVGPLLDSLCVAILDAVERGH